MSLATESTRSLADLHRWPAGVEQWSSNSVALAVVGRPVGHSLSPLMHNTALAALAKKDPEFAHWRYFKFDIAPEELPEALGLFHKNKFRGLNLTVPHKALVIPHLNSKDAFVQDAGAANTLSYTETGWRGTNTDGYGLATALREQLDVNLKGANIVLLGAGGAARGAAVECLHAGCKSLWIGNRTQATLAALLISLKTSQSLGALSAVEGFDPESPPMSLPAGCIVINATSLGLKPDDGSPLDLRKISGSAKVFDMIYRPPQTALLRQAAQLKIPNANGLSMLIHQGVRSLELWTGKPAPVEIMQRTVRAALD